MFELEEEEQETFLGNVACFGINYPVFKKWGDNDGYIYYGKLNGRRVPFYKYSDNDWRDNLRRPLSTESMKALNKLDKEAGFKELEKS